MSIDKSCGERVRAIRHLGRIPSVRGATRIPIEEERSVAISKQALLWAGEVKNYSHHIAACQSLNIGYTAQASACTNTSKTSGSLRARLTRRCWNN
jgi:hypothetical protein